MAAAPGYRSRALYEVFESSCLDVSSLAFVHFSDDLEAIGNH
jgi:hypothetical protein